MEAVKRKPDQTAITLIVVGTAYLIFILLGMPDGMLGVAWPSIMSTFGVSLDRMGVLLIASTAGFMITSFSAGRLIGGLGIVTMLTIACILRGASLVGMAFAPTWISLVGTAFIFGLGSGAIDAGMNTYFAFNLSPRLMNWLHASFGLGATLGPILLTAFLSMGLAWRWGYALVGILQASLAILLVLRAGAWKTRAETGTYAEEERRVAHKSYRATLSRWIVWVNVALFFCYAGTEVTAGSWSYTLFTESRGISVAVAGLWAGLYWGSFTLGRFFFGIVANYVNVINTIRAMILVSFFAALLLWWNPVNGVSLLGLLVLGFAMAPVFPLLISSTPARMGVGDATNAIGLQVGAASLGIALLPGLAGVLAERINLEIIPPYMAIVILVMFVLHEIAIRGHSREASTDARF